ncbi:hypothetical protein ACLKA7_013576 [Drosophila subpalustris]
MGDEGGEATPAPTTSTTSGAQAVFQTNAWLSAAAVAVYTTKALWVKLREMGFGKGNSGNSDNEADRENLDANGNPIVNSLDLNLDNDHQSQLHPSVDLDVF